MSKGAHASAACMHLHAFGLCHVGNKAPSMFAQRKETRESHLRHGRGSTRSLPASLRGFYQPRRPDKTGPRCPWWGSAKPSRMLSTSAAPAAMQPQVEGTKQNSIYRQHIARKCAVSLVNKSRGADRKGRSSSWTSWTADILLTE